MAKDKTEAFVTIKSTITTVELPWLSQFSQLFLAVILYSSVSSSSLLSIHIDKTVLLITHQPNIAHRSFCIQNEWDVKIIVVASV